MIHEMGRDSDRERPLPVPNNSTLAAVGYTQLPNLIVRAGDRAARRFVEFFAATIRNRNTRSAYTQAVGQFCSWCEKRGVELAGITPVVIAAYIEELTAKRSAPTVKQHLAAVRMLFDFLVTGHVVDINPAWWVRGPRHVVKKGKTPVLTATEARQLLDSIETDTLIGLRDDRPHVLQLCPRIRHSRYERGRLLPAGKAFLVPAA